MARREIVESPIEIGEDEVVPYTLTIPTTWGTPTSPTGVVKDSKGAAVSGAISSGPTVAASIISFTVDAAATLTRDADYRLEIKFSVAGGTLEAWATLLCRE